MSRLPGSIDHRKKDAVLDAAAAIVVARGPSASLGQIARRSGVSKQTIYNYFGDKQGLFQALLESSAGPAECPTCAYPMDGAPAQFLAAYAKILLDWQRRLRLAAGLRAVISAQGPEPTSRALAAGDAGAARAVQALARALAEAAQRGRMRIDDPVEAAELFLNLVTAGRSLGMSHPRLDAGLAADIDTAADACGRIFAQAFAPTEHSRNEEFVANRARRPAGRSAIAYPAHSREEASL